MTLKCSRCKKYKPTTEFYLQKRYSRGFSYECRECTINYKRENRKKTIESRRQYQLMHKFGITQEQFETMLANQEHLCGICYKEWEEYPVEFGVDHDRGCCLGNRSCGKCLRGLLCRECNRNLGWYEKVGQVSINRYLNTFNKSV